jgi:hypothetical protein
MLNTHLHPVLRSKMVELHVHYTIRLHSVVLTRTTLPYLCRARLKAPSGSNSLKTSLQVKNEKILFNSSFEIQKR